MSALPPKADIGQRELDVRSVPLADMSTVTIRRDNSFAAPGKRCEL
jgi:hypothetical protein